MIARLCCGARKLRSGLGARDSGLGTPGSGLGTRGSGLGTSGKGVGNRQLGLWNRIKISLGDRKDSFPRLRGKGRMGAFRQARTKATNRFSASWAIITDVIGCVGSGLPPSHPSPASEGRGNRREAGVGARDSGLGTRGKGVGNRGSWRGNRQSANGTRELGIGNWDSGIGSKSRLVIARIPSPASGGRAGWGLSGKREPRPQTGTSPEGEYHRRDRLRWLGPAPIPSFPRKRGKGQ